MTELRKRFINDVQTKTAPELLVVAVKLPTGAIEILAITSELTEKIQHYMDAYDDEFKLKSNPANRIIGYKLV
ncbi:MAG: hypothetical protein GX664_04130 [Bacteroidales bacterium]|nr:hypothetical protein [Bacteroidales bacterium]